MRIAPGPALLSCLIAAAVSVACGATAADEVAERFSPCEDWPRVDHGPGGAEAIAETSTWLHVTEVVSADRDGDRERRTLPSTVVVESALPALPVSSTGEVEVLVHASFWPGIDWALANGAQVWFSLGAPESFDGPYVLFVLVVRDDGRVFFPGECLHHILYDPVAATFGDRTDEMLRKATRVVGDDLRELLGVGGAGDAATADV